MLLDQSRRSDAADAATLEFGAGIKFGAVTGVTVTPHSEVLQADPDLWRHTISGSTDGLGKASLNAWTTSGSNWVPTQRSSSSIAIAGVREAR